MVAVLLWGLAIGVVHFAVVGGLYGNPGVDRLYQEAQSSHPAVRKWNSKAKYLVLQFLGTQLEVYVLTVGFFWLRPSVDVPGLSGALLLGLLFSGIRVYPRFWNMWIQSTYPGRLLTIEFINGVISTLVVICGLQLFTGGV